ncbi:hypothetical protein FQN60_016980, partial [Etheostoma spectabile]
MGEEEVAHWFFPQDNIVDTFVVEGAGGVLTDFVSFYTLPSTVMHHPLHTSLKAAYSFYNVHTQTPLLDLMNDALILAKLKGFDVFNALDLMENKVFLEKLKFGIGDGNLQYYLYNWKCPAMDPDKVGLVLQVSNYFFHLERLQSAGRGRSRNHLRFTLKFSFLTLLLTNFLLLLFHVNGVFSVSEHLVIFGGTPPESQSEDTFQPQQLRHTLAQTRHLAGRHTSGCAQRYQVIRHVFRLDRLAHKQQSELIPLQSFGDLVDANGQLSPSCHICPAVFGRILLLSILAPLNN